MARRTKNTSHKSSLSMSPFLHVVLRRSEYETWPEFKQLQHSRSTKGAHQTDFTRYSLQKSETNSVVTTINAKNNTSTVSRQQLPKKKQSISNRSVDGVMKDQRQRSLPLSSWRQVHQETPNRVSEKQYVFDRNSSFYPSHVPLKYSFQIRSLLKRRQLSSWRFDQHDKNQMIYHGVFPSSNAFASLHSPEKNGTKPQSRQGCMTNTPFLPPPSSSESKHHPSRNALPITSRLIDCHVQHRWLQSLLNCDQQKEQDSQLIPTVHQLPLPSSTGVSSISSNVLSPKLVSKVCRRARCRTFEEHLQRYYASKWALTSTRDFGRARLS